MTTENNEKCVILTSTNINAVWKADQTNASVDDIHNIAMSAEW